MVNYNKLEKINSDLWHAKASRILESTEIFPYNNVSDEIIEKYLLSGQFIDTIDGIHKENTINHHAQRIASLINLIQTGVTLKPVLIYCNYINDEVFHIQGIDDGWHRLRASYYLDQPIRFILDFNE